MSDNMANRITNILTENGAIESTGVSKKRTALTDSIKERADEVVDTWERNNPEILTKLGYKISDNPPDSPTGEQVKKFEQYLKSVLPVPKGYASWEEVDAAKVKAVEEGYKETLEYLKTKGM